MTCVLCFKTADRVDRYALTGLPKLIFFMKNKNLFIIQKHLYTVIFFCKQEIYFFLSMTWQL